jgi:hypothetical protein
VLLTVPDTQSSGCQVGRFGGTPAFLLQSPMRIKKLNDLKNAFIPKAPYWSAWINYCDCSLDGQNNIYIYEEDG